MRAREHKCTTAQARLWTSSVLTPSCGHRTPRGSRCHPAESALDRKNIAGWMGSWEPVCPLGKPGQSFLVSCPKWHPSLDSRTSRLGSWSRKADPPDCPERAVLGFDDRKHLNSEPFSHGRARAIGRLSAHACSAIGTAMVTCQMPLFLKR